MKSKKFRSLLETTLGPLRVSTVTVPWWLTTITLGFFRKAICRISGEACRREKELHAEWAERLYHMPRRRKLKQTTVSYIISPCVKLLHKHMVKYAKGLEKIISDNHQTMQLYYSLQEAEYNEDYKLANEILKEIREHDAHQWHRIRHLEGKNK